MAFLTVLALGYRRISAETITATSTVTVPVQQMFFNTITNGGVLAYEITGPNSTQTKTVTVTVTSNSGNPWHLSLSANPLSSGGTVLPSSALTYSISGAGNGVFVPSSPAQFAEVPTTPMDVYTSGTGEGIVYARDFILQIKLVTPAYLPGGTYGTTLNLTLTSD